MIQDQLVEYVSTQLKLGISRDTLKSALVGVGWAAQDAEDTIKKVEAGSTTVAATIGTPFSAPKTSVSPVASMGGVKNPEPQMIRVSDLVSSGGSSIAPAMSSPLAAQKGNVTTSSAPKMGPAFQGAQFVQKPQGKFGMVTMVLSVLVLLLAGFSGYLLFKNNAMSSASLGSAAGTSDQLNMLQAQLQSVDASNTALMAEMNSLQAQNQDILNNLALFAVVPTLAPTNGATSSPVSFTGTLSLGVGKSALYTLTTSYGAKAYVKNSADPLARAALDPLLGVSSPVTLSGMFVPGNPNITVIMVNGTPIAPQTPASATTTGQ